MTPKTPPPAATGRRKTAVARVHLLPGTGAVTVNGETFEKRFPVESVRQAILQPLDIVNLSGKFDLRAWVKGGGTVGQAGALRLALARALVRVEAGHREALKASGCLTRDPRMKERKKPGRPGARRRFQFSKR